MKIVVMFASLVALLNAFELKGDITSEYVAYSHSSNEVQFLGSLEAKYKGYVEAQVSLNYLYSTKYSQRNYANINEAYILKEYDNFTLSLGKRVFYIGELEGFNIADIINAKDYLKDPFDISAKLGSYVVNYTYFFENDNSFEVGIKLYEENLDLGDSSTPYYILPLRYNDKLLTQKSKHTPSFYASYSFGADEFIEYQNKIMFWYGYDNKRDFIYQDDNLYQYAYRVNKLIFLSHIVYEDMIFKFEGSYSDVIDYKKMSDYYQLGFGMQKGFYDIGGVDLTLFLEYYHYGYKDDKLSKNIDISEVYDNDLFIALRGVLNDSYDTSLKLGMLYDIKNKEKLFKLQSKSKITDSIALSTEFLRILPSQNTLLANTKDKSRVKISASYSF
jgi:hypothetical protein